MLPQGYIHRKQVRKAKGQGMALSLRRLWMPRCFPFEFERINAKPLVELENQNDFSDHLYADLAGE
jgi:hypothetical protein